MNAVAQSQTFSRALILGATGMIGAHAVRACLKRGIAVRALVRSTSDLRNLAGLQVERAVGDLMDPPSLIEAMDGCDVVLHAAAPYPTRYFGKAKLIDGARKGMQHVLDAAAASPHVTRLVYVSSVTTIGLPTGPDGRPAPHSRPACEQDTDHPIRDSAPYFDLKQTLEEMARFAAAASPKRAASGAQGRCEVVIVNPTFCIDALDANRTTAQLLVPLAKRQIPAYIPGVLNAVPTQDVGEGIVLAAERGKNGERYILGGENMASDELLKRCALIAGVPAPTRGFPIRLAEAVSMVTEVIAFLTRTRPLFPMAGIRMSRHGQALDTGRAERELGYRATDLDAAIQRAYDWYRQQGFL